MVLDKPRDVSVLILYNKERKMLLQHRTEDAPRLPGYWGFFGGGLEPGEKQKDALYREIKEELSYVPKSPKLVRTQNVSIGLGKKYIYIEECDESQKLVLGEGQGMAWVTADEAIKLKMINHDKEAILFLKKNYSNNFK